MKCVWPLIEGWIKKTWKKSEVAQTTEEAVEESKTILSELKKHKRVLREFENKAFLCSCRNAKTFSAVLMKNVNNYKNVVSQDL